MSTLVIIIAVVGIILSVIGRWASANPKYRDAKWPWGMAWAGIVLMAVAVLLCYYVMLFFH